jgi:hypothetical protein
MASKKAKPESQGKKNGKPNASTGKKTAAKKTPAKDPDDDIVEEDIVEDELAEDDIIVDEEVDPDELDPDDLADDLLDEDDEAFVAEEDDFDDEEEEADDLSPAARRKASDDEDDDDLTTPDDVEADLDTILKDRLVAGDDVPVDDEEEQEVDERSTDGDTLQPRRADEEMCKSCFLLVRRSAPNCPVGDDDCPIFAAK